MIQCTDLVKYLTGPGRVESHVDVYGRVWAKVHGDITLYGETDEPLPYMIEVFGKFSFAMLSNNCPHVKASEIDLTETTAATVYHSQMQAREAIVIKRSVFVHLPKRTKRCNKFIFV